MLPRESPSLEVFKTMCRGGTLGYGLAGMVVMGWQLDLMTSEVFSNLNDSMTLNQAHNTGLNIRMQESVIPDSKHALRVQFWPGQMSILLGTVHRHRLRLNISGTVLNRQFSLRHLLGFSLLMGFFCISFTSTGKTDFFWHNPKNCFNTACLRNLVQGKNCSLLPSRQSPKITLAIISLHIYAVKTPPKKRNLGWESGVVLCHSTESQTICRALDITLLCRRH